MIGVLWYLSLKGMRELWVKPIRYYEMTYDRKKGFAETTCCQWACQNLMQFVTAAFTELPIVLIGALALQAFERYFFAAVLVLTGFINIAM